MVLDRLRVWENDERFWFRGLRRNDGRVRIDSSFCLSLDRSRSRSRRRDESIERLGFIDGNWEESGNEENDTRFERLSVILASWSRSRALRFFMQDGRGSGSMALLFEF